MVKRSRHIPNIKKCCLDFSHFSPEGNASQSTGNWGSGQLSVCGQPQDWREKVVVPTDEAATGPAAGQPPPPPAPLELEKQKQRLRATNKGQFQQNAGGKGCLGSDNREGWIHTDGETQTESYQKSTTYHPASASASPEPAQGTRPSG